MRGTRHSKSVNHQGLHLKVESRTHSQLELAVELSAMEQSPIWLSHHSSLLDRHNENVIGEV